MHSFQPPYSKPPETDPEFLLARLRTGDREPYDLLVRRYHGPMLAVARRLLRSDEDSADAVQDTFLSAFRSVDSFEGRSTLWTWLYRILVNACRAQLRARVRNRALSLHDLGAALEESTGHAASATPATEPACTRAAGAELRAQVRACIDRLPGAYRTVLLLRDIEQLSTDQTARRLHTSPGAVKSRLHRARQALRCLLEPFVRTEGSGPAASA
jgi:RNA polymerase sigma-70 factor (ECF subfamily)